jgi:ADP-ribose pyrophosphatase YjhB (NUDIX family)
MSRHRGLAEGQAREPAVQWAGIILVNPAGHLLLNLRDVDVPHPNYWNVIAGVVEQDETPAQCIVREMLEETGQRLDKFEFFREDKLEPKPGMRVISTTYYAYLDKPAHELVLGEGQEHRFFTPSDLDGLRIVPWTDRVLRAFLASAVYRRMAVGAGTGVGPHPDPFPGAERTVCAAPSVGEEGAATVLSHSPSPRRERGPGGEVSPRQRP